MTIRAGTQTETFERTDAETEHAPLFQLILFNDDEHSYPYVMEMLGNLFAIGPQEAFQIAYEVDFIGQAVVKVCPLEEALIGRDQIMCYGPDHRVEHSNGSMVATVQEVMD